MCEACLRFGNDRHILETDRIRDLWQEAMRFSRARRDQGKKERRTHGSEVAASLGDSFKLGWFNDFIFEDLVDDLDWNSGDDAVLREGREGKGSESPSQLTADSALPCLLPLSLYTEAMT